MITKDPDTLMMKIWITPPSKRSRTTEVLAGGKESKNI